MPKREPKDKKVMSGSHLSERQKQILDKITEPHLNPAQLMLCAKEIDFLKTKDAKELFQHIPGVHCLLLYLFLDAHHDTCRECFLIEMNKKMATKEQRELRNELIIKAKNLLDPITPEAGIESFKQELRLGMRYLELADAIQEHLKQFHPNETSSTDEQMLYALEGYKLICDLYSRQAQ